jgi:Uma2 family endonuclease
MLMTPEEFDAIEDYDEAYHYELIHGVVIVNPIPLSAEVGPTEVLGYLLWDYRSRHSQGSALNLTLHQRYLRTKDSRRIADRVIWAALGRNVNWDQEQPTAAVEFVSARSRDRHRDSVEKRQECMEAGLVEYWIIDRFQRIMTVCRRRGKKIDEIVIRENESYTTPMLPSFELPLARVLEVADLTNQPQQPTRRPRRT